MGPPLLYHNFEKKQENTALYCRTVFFELKLSPPPADLFYSIYEKFFRKSLDFIEIKCIRKAVFKIVIYLNTRPKVNLIAITASAHDMKQLPPFLSKIRINQGSAFFAQDIGEF